MNVNNEFEKQNLIDEQFCLSFELKAMADLLIRRETERWVSGFSDITVEKEHDARYKWVSKFVKGKRVLDIACGSGKGSYTLAYEGDAKEVIGCDLDSNAIKYASIRNKHPNVSFTQQDAQRYHDSIKYDAIVSFETIEHLPNVEVFLKGITELLSPEGYFYVSTPISKKPIDTKPENPYHIQEWGLEEFQNLISKYFSIESVYLQMRSVYAPLIIFNLKKKIYRFLESKQMRNTKEKYLADENKMRPIKYDNLDSIFFSNTYGIVGYQILIVRKKL